jgi:hypothetical protein
MKKQLKKLSLSKKVVSNFENISGGRAPKTHGQTCEGLSCELCGGDSEAGGHCEPESYYYTCPTN